MRAGPTRAGPTRAGPTRAGPTTGRNLVVGYGNPLRGDDGVGWHAAAALAADPRLADTDVITGHQLTPKLAEDIAKARLAVLVDARLGDTPGYVCIREVAPAPGAVLVTPCAAGGRRRAGPGVVRRRAAGVPR